jgi:hypothetical protein
MAPQRIPGLTERRRSQRVRIRGRLPAFFLTTPIPIAIRNISLGGILVESAAPFLAGTVHQFRMKVDGDDADRSPVLTAECLYCYQEMLPDGSTCYLAGFTFTGTPGDEAERQIFDLVDQATAMSSYQL